jgi:hypothetical protein
MELTLSVSGTPKSPQVATQIDRILSKGCFAVFEAWKKCKSQKSNIKIVELPPCGNAFLNFALCTLIFELSRHAGWAFLGLLPEGGELSAFFDVR